VTERRRGNHPASPAHDETGERLQKVLARAGFGSRRACDELIAAGRVRVGGTTAMPGQRVSPGDAVEVDGVPVPTAPGLVYYLVNKPRGVLSAAVDRRGRPTLTSLVPPEPRVFSVGRLDLNSEGLVILTNDGDLAFALSHPSGGVEKEYLVDLDRAPGPGALRTLRRGVALDDGMTAPARVGVVSPGVIRIVLHEGRNRQVRRMCEAVGVRVRRLVRTRIGPLTDPSLRPGRWRRLSATEVRSLTVAAHRATAEHIVTPRARGGRR
jgi:23S rRNA pseudouridine2605 synthase